MKRNEFIVSLLGLGALGIGRKYDKGLWLDFSRDGAKPICGMVGEWDSHGKRLYRLEFSEKFFNLNESRRMEMIKTMMEKPPLMCQYDKKPRLGKME